MYFLYDLINDPLPPTRLDDYLDRGYFRLGAGMYREDLTYHEGKFLNSFRTRLSLTDHALSKSQRKLLRRNARFRIEYTDDTLTREHFEIDRRYRYFRDRPAGNIRHVIRGMYSTENYFDTRQIKVYDGDRLVGYSFYDVGTRYGASLMGVYEPEYAKYSLGYYTMLLEMEWLRDHGYVYYSPGSVTPGQRAMDYKRRVGPLDYFNVYQQQWLPLADLDAPNDLAIHTVERRMLFLAAQLMERGIPAGMGYYELYGIKAEMLERKTTLVDNYAAPIVLWLLPEGASEQFLVLFDYARQKWLVYHVPSIEGGFSYGFDEFHTATVSQWLAFPRDHQILVDDERIVNYLIQLCLHYIDRTRS